MSIPNGQYSTLDTSGLLPASKDMAILIMIKNEWLDHSRTKLPLASKEKTF
jgi:hypothetical protein